MTAKPKKKAAPPVFLAPEHNFRLPRQGWNRAHKFNADREMALQG